MLLQALQPIFDPTFSAHSFGFRPGKSAHDAVRAAQSYVQAGKNWVVDMDITKFFDRVNHDILMNRIGQTIRDKRVLGLIGRYLRAGVMVEGLVEELPESDRRRAAGQLVRLCPRLVGVLPPGRGTPEHLRTGGMDTATHPGLLLATMGQLARAAA